ncbi:thioesterase II family protein [Dictyobacter vulcani]|nr:thioesterase domain-containing protein [Dictyobacter vulcani]
MTSTAHNPWIIMTQPNHQARLRLFCFSYAGGAASNYRVWQGKFPAEIEICAVQLPGRENRLMDPLFTHMTPLITSLASAIRPYLDIPFVFFGHSMGALVSFELTRQLRREQAELPLHLFVSAHRAPQLPDPDPPYTIFPA